MGRESTAALAGRAAGEIKDAFDLYLRSFNHLTRCARTRFEARDWQGQARDAVERLDLYRRVVDRVVTEMQILLAAHVRYKPIWVSTHAAYSDFILGRDDLELAETFFNSITRRIFATVGVDPAIEYVDSDFAASPDIAAPIYRTYPTGSSKPEGGADNPQSFVNLQPVIAAILRDCAFSVAYEDLSRDARLVAGEIERWSAASATLLAAIEMLPVPFYRNKGAYLVGRMRAADGRLTPVLLALLNGDQGVYVDACLLTEDEVSIVFSYTRSYFLVETACPYLLVDFLKSIMPLKRRAELYTSIGHNKHGKTELYRDLYCHLQDSAGHFELAAGDRGMVMSVFTMPSFDVVFKVINDTFAYPKRTTRADVMSRYQLVFKHDRAGRLVDAQEFERLSFDRARFTDEALDALLTHCGNTVTLVGDRVDIRHLYTERRLTPLNLHLRAGGSAADAAVLEYGQAIKDMAATNIFPGDLFTKNFGVTRHGRVVFYDYDELTLLTSCNFRVMPASRDANDDLGDPQPWFSVADNDIFPEEFRSFLGLDRHLMRVFCSAHEDLFDPTWWRRMQARVAAGEVIDLFPYPESKRLQGGGSRS